MKNICLLLHFVLFFNLVLSAQQKIVEQIEFSFLIGYQAGGQGENRNFVTKNGLNLQANALYQLNTQIYTGIGFGITKLENETFLPLFIAVKGKLKDIENSAYLKANIGGAVANNYVLDELEQYEFHGGIYFNMGFGKQWAITKKISLNIEIDIEFQEAELEYESFSGTTFSDDMQNYFLSFKTGIAF